MNKKEKVKLEVKKLKFGYKKKLLVLNDINFSAIEGEIIGIIGGNGQGKTTFLKILAGLLNPVEGNIFINGKVTNSKERLNKTYFVMQDSDYQLYGESVFEELFIGIDRTYTMEQYAKNILKELGLNDLINRHPASLSGGQKQRVVIGASFMKNGSILLLDEPTSGLDYENMKKLSSILIEESKKGKIICIISHDYQFLKESCDRIINIDEGTIKNDFDINSNEDFLYMMEKEVFESEISSSS